MRADAERTVAARLAFRYDMPFTVRCDGPAVRVVRVQKTFRCGVDAPVELYVSTIPVDVGGRDGPIVPIPWPRISATFAPPSVHASASPSACVFTSMSVAGPPASRISKIGTPAPRNEPMWYAGRSGVEDGRARARTGHAADGNTGSMKRAIAALAAALLTTAAAQAQPNPGDPGAGEQRGMEQVNNSGQVGTATLFRRGTSTRVVVELHGTEPGRVQSVRIYRGPSCDDLGGKPQYFLTDLRAGRSVSTVAAPEEKLLSGNYDIVVFSTNRAGAPTTACGHLYT